VPCHISEDRKPQNCRTFWNSTCIQSNLIIRLTKGKISRFEFVTAMLLRIKSSVIIRLVDW